MLFIGAQFVIWSVTGAYMVFFNIDYIHGDTLVINHQNKIDPNNINFTLKSLQQQYPDADKVRVGMFINKEVYRFSVDKVKYLVDANNGQLLSPLSETSGIEAAKYIYSGQGDISNVEFIEDSPPFELSRRMHDALPAWRVNFDDLGSPSLYISARSGELLAKRHDFWRLFDWMFRFHVMDYEESDIANSLLFWFTFLGIIAAISGLFLTYFRVFKSDKTTTAIDKATTEEQPNAFN
tara:strand:- start:4734 stop:5444 length:711 start_codon:yes stop_codon:yes gene_type:complete